MSNYRLRPSSVYNGQQELDLDEGLSQLGHQTTTFHTSQNGLNTVSRSYATTPSHQPLQQAYSSTELHRFSQNADKYTSNVSYYIEHH